MVDQGEPANPRIGLAQVLLIDLRQPHQQPLRQAFIKEYVAITSSFEQRRQVTNPTTMV